VFQVKSHPIFTEYEQCINHLSFESSGMEHVYHFFGLFIMHIFPMLTILVCYFAIFREINKIAVVRVSKGNRHTISWKSMKMFCFRVIFILQGCLAEFIPVKVLKECY
jgi:hypothetical protein